MTENAYAIKKLCRIVEAAESINEAAREALFGFSESLDDLTPQQRISSWMADVEEALKDVPPGEVVVYELVRFRNRIMELLEDERIKSFRQPSPARDQS